MNSEQKPMSDYDTPPQSDDETQPPQSSRAPVPEPPHDDDSTDELDPRLLQSAPEPDEDDVPFHLPLNDSGGQGDTINRRKDSNSAPTMPHFREPGVPDPRETLLGTGGLDPNPDMQPYRESQPTVRNMPRVPQPAAQQPIQSAQPTPSNAPRRYQQAQGAYVPPPTQSPASQRPRPKQNRRRRRIFGLPTGCVFIFLGLLLTFCGGSFLLTAGAAAVFIPRIEQQWSSEIARVDDYRAFESTFYYDRAGNQLYEAFNEGRRDTVAYSDFPEELIQATISIEDDTFFDNIGIDIAATLVATVQYLTADAGVQTPGGSTITQQTVRNVLFDFEKRATRSVARKAEEIMLAIVLTTRRSKEDILALYLNEIYYGNLAYGAQAAAQTFFGKDVQDLTLGEAALLAGLPQSPANFDPLSPDPNIQERVTQRWREVLTEMVEEGYITQAEMNATLQQGLNFAVPDENALQAPHFTVYAQDEFEEMMLALGYSEADVSRGGYRIYTTLDQDINEMAQTAARDQVASLSGRNISNASVVVIQPITGEVVSMVGSIDYYNGAIDGRVNVAIALRQPGSTMKPFTYAAALERGMTAGDVIWDTRTDIEIAGQPTYTPRNYDGRFHGPMTMRMALANSYNIPAVQTVRYIGVDVLIEMMQRVGVSTLNDPSRYGISLTLGGGEVSLLEFANAYGVFANQGTYVPPTTIRCIVDSDNNIIYQYENGCPLDANFTSATVDRRGFGTQVMDPRVAFTITDMLSDNAARTPAMGANSMLNTPGIDSAVKTGTTNDIKDNWTVGYTRNVVVGVWVGNNDGDPMVNSSGLTGAAPIWNSVMTQIYDQQAMLDVFRVDGQLLPDVPPPPAGMSLKQLCNVRRITDPTSNCNSFINEWFLDSPAGVPDGNGNLVYPARNNPNALAQNEFMQEISPDVYRTLVYPLNPNVAAGIRFPIGAGELQPPPPKYCRVTPATRAQATGAQQLIFIAGPATSQSDAVRAEEYARNNNLAYLPTIECQPSLLTGGGNLGAPITTAVITSPSGNSYRQSDTIPIIGTAQFNNQQVDFYHLDIIGEQFSNWTPLGEEGYAPVVNGQLGVITPYALPPGNYRLRVRLWKNGTFVQQPYEVAFTVTQ